MEGYDAILIGNFWAYPTFQKKYGRWVGVTDRTRSGYQLTPAWQAGLGNGAGVGAFFGSCTPFQEICTLNSITNALRCSVERLLG